MNKNFGQRLLAARKQAGLSQDQLVEKINGEVKKTAIAKYERGEMMPRFNIIEKLARALNQPEDYFFRTLTLDIEKVEFRAKAGISTRRSEMLQQSILSRTENYFELEHLMGITTLFANPLQGIVIYSSHDVETAAETLRQKWQLGDNPLGSVMGIFENKGIKVIEIDWDEDFEGYSAYVNKLFPVIAIRKSATTERKRFTAFHEAAHLLLQFDKTLKAATIEKLCHYFAGAMLFPKSAYLREVGSVRYRINKFEMGLLKDKYGISAQALVRRGENLGVISRAHTVPMIEIIKQDKYEMHIGSNRSVDRPTRFDQLITRALNEGSLSLTKAAMLAGMDFDKFIQYYTDNEHTINH
jgi:Zn-dependent peptidase ImmA (M78 family)/transcriptional regulator with XRE-family HTH domain